MFLRKQGYIILGVRKKFVVRVRDRIRVRVTARKKSLRHWKFPGGPPSRY